MLHLFIAIPSMDRVHADFMMNLVHMQQYIFQHPIEQEMGLTIINRRGSIIHDSREDLANQALDREATHLLWLDSDMSFPEDLFHRLLEHDLDAVACNYVQRIIPAHSNARDTNGVELLTYEDSSGLEEAQSAGYGACLIKTDVLKRMSRPWFDTVWFHKEKTGKIHWPDRYDLLGEDVFFFKKLKAELGVSLYIDHDLSHQIGHMGDFEYTNNLASIS